MSSRKPGRTGTHRGRKYVARRILWVQASKEVTSRGYPRQYTSVYECGHGSMQSHGPGIAVKSFVYTIERSKSGPMSRPDIMAYCFECGSGAALDWFDRSRIGRLPHTVVERVPGLEALYNSMTGPAFKEPDVIKRVRWNHPEHPSDAYGPCGDCGQKRGNGCEGIFNCGCPEGAFDP